MCCFAFFFPSPHKFKLFVCTRAASFLHNITFFLFSKTLKKNWWSQSSNLWDISEVDSFLNRLSGKLIDIMFSNSVFTLSHNLLLLGGKLIFAFICSAFWIGEYRALFWWITFLFSSAVRFSVPRPLSKESGDWLILWCC